MWKERVRQFQNKRKPKKVHKLKYFGGGKANNNFHPFHSSCCILVLELKWMWTNVITACNVTAHTNSNYFQKILRKLNGYPLLYRTRTITNFCENCEKPIDTSVYDVMLGGYLLFYAADTYLYFYLFSHSLSRSQLFFFILNSCTHNIVCVRQLSQLCVAFLHLFIHSFIHSCVCVFSTMNAHR